MFGFFKKKAAKPDLHFAAKGYMQVAITRQHRPDFDLHVIERGYAAELLDEGCSTQQAWSARWGGVCAINGSPSDFEDAVAAMREARRETGMSERMGSKEEAEAMYLAAATAVVTLQNTMDPEGYPHFLRYIGAH
ncbi:hypothetical protein ACH37Y_20185 [Sphingomonas paucimobilis]